MQMLSMSYDATADALYIRLRSGQVARTRDLDPWTLVDEDAAGTALGIEVIHPARTWPVQEFLERYRIEGPNRKLLEGMFPSPGRGTAAFAADVDADSVGRLEAIYSLG